MKIVNAGVSYNNGAICCMPGKYLGGNENRCGSRKNKYKYAQKYRFGFESQSVSISFISTICTIKRFLAQQNNIRVMKNVFQ